MSQAPLELRAAYTLPANWTRKICCLSFAFPDTGYVVWPDFGHNCGSVVVTNLATNKFRVTVGTSNGANKSFGVRICWGGA